MGFVKHLFHYMFVLLWFLHLNLYYFAGNNEILRVRCFKFLVLYISKFSGLVLFWLVIPVLECFQSTTAYQDHVISNVNASSCSLWRQLKKIFLRKFEPQDLILKISDL